MRQLMNDANYESITDFVAAMAAPSNNPINESLRKQWGYDDSRGDWYGADCKTGKDVQAKMRDGWPQGRDRLNELRDHIGEIDNPPQDRRRKLVRTSSGDTLDIHSVYNGRLDIAWRVARRRNTSAPQRVDLCANMICSAHEHADVLFWRGAAAALLTDILESAGYSVRLVVTFGGQVPETGEQVSCRITVKDHGNPFDITSTSATIMPGFFRALGHAWIAGHCKKKMSESGISVRQGKLEPNEILLSHQIRDRGTALAFVNNTIAKINEGAMIAA
jgi:hypothetical protein